MSTLTNEITLTESRAMRAATGSRTDALDKVKALTLLPDGIHISSDLVASYFGVGGDAIESVVRRNRKELEGNGYTVLRGAELREFETVNLTGSKRRALALFTRRTVLNVAQLLAESDVARSVRTYLIELEQQASPQARSEAVDRAALAEARIRMLKETDGFLDAAWVRLKIAHQAAYGLGEEPEVDPLDKPLYVPDFLKSKGLKRSQIASVQSWFGRRLAAFYEAETGEVRPGKRSEDIATSGSVRETVAWTERHRPYFQGTWDRYYAKDYPQQPDIFGGES